MQPAASGCNHDSPTAPDGPHAQGARPYLAQRIGCENREGILLSPHGLWAFRCEDEGVLMGLTGAQL